MPARSKVTGLPADLRDELNARLIANGFSGYEALAEWLTNQGYALTRSSVQRYASALERRGAAIRASTEAARQIADAAPDDADLRSNAIISLVQTELFEALLSVSDAKNLSPSDRVELYSKAAKNIVSLTRASIARYQWAAEVKARVEAAESQVYQRLQAGGAGADLIATVFGDMVSYKAGDAYGCVLLGDKDEALSGAPGTIAYGLALHRLAFASAWNGWLARNYAQLPGAVEAWGLLEGGRGESATYGHVGGSGQPYPSPVDNGLYALGVQLCERAAAGNVLRARLPGLLNPLHVRPLGHLATVGGVTGLDGRTLPACDVAAFEVGPGATVGQALFDLTGPWR